MFDRNDLLKKLKMIWDNNDDINIRGNLIREYFEKRFQNIGINSDGYILMIVDFEDKKEVTSSLRDMTVIRVDYLNMKGDLDQLIEAIDNMFSQMSRGSMKSCYEIEDLSKKIKR